MTDLQVAYNRRTKTVVIQDEGDDVPTGYVSIGSINPDAYATLSHAIRDALYQRSAADPSQRGMFPDNITDIAHIEIHLTTGTIEEFAFGELELEDGEEEVPYNFIVPFSGGVPPYTFELVSPTPEGIELDPDTLVVTWEVPTAGEHAIKIQGTDGAETVINETYALTIEEAPGGEE